MTFYTNDNYTLTDTIELNTLNELKAYALGGDGKITIDFCKIHPITGGVLSLPVIEREKEK